MSQLDFGIFAIGGSLSKRLWIINSILISKFLCKLNSGLIPVVRCICLVSGLPSFFALAVACGADTFDSADLLFVCSRWTVFYTTVHKKHYGFDRITVRLPNLAANHTAKELQEMEKTVKSKTLAEHNLYLLFAELRTILLIHSERIALGIGGTAGSIAPQTLKSI